MPYFFFKEKPNQHGWQLLMEVPTFELAKQEQPELRRIEKLDGCVIHVVFAESEEAAIQAHRKIYHYSVSTRVRNTGKHA